MSRNESQGLRAQAEESLTINQVLDLVYDEIVAGFDPRKTVRSFNNEFCRWDTFNDWGSTRGIYFTLSGILFEVKPNIGILVVKGDERETSWYSSLVKVVAWNRLEVGGDGKYKVQIRDYPSWDEVPLRRLIFELPKSLSESSVRGGIGGLLVNQGQRLALNGVIPMQPKFVIQKETVNPGVVRGPGGVPILLEEPRRKTDEMYADDIVTLGTLYKPEIVPYLVKQIKRSFTK